MHLTRKRKGGAMDDVAGTKELDYASDLQLIKSMHEDDSFWDRIFDAKLDLSLIHISLLGIVAGHLRRDVGVGELDVQVVGERVDGARDAQRVQGLARQQVGRVRVLHQALRQLVQHLSLIHI